MKMLIKFKQIIAMFLTVCLLMCCTMVSAETDRSIEPNQSETTENAITVAIEDLPVNVRNLLPEDKAERSVYLQASELKNGIFEDAELYTLRTEKSSTGEGTLMVHSAPIKYVDEEGKLRFIDTALQPIDSVRSDYSYRNVANSFTVQYGTSITTGINFDSAFTFAVKETVSSKNTQKVTKTAIDKVMYANAFGANTAVEYINTENGIKENIILNKYTGQTRFDFTFRSETHIPILAENGMFIWVADKNNLDEPDYRFLSLYAYDSYDPAIHGINKESDFRHMNEELYYELTSNFDGSYTITLVVPEEYLTHPEIVYPVTIDPSITCTSSNSNTHDSFVNAGAPSATGNGTLDYIRFGKVNGYKNFGYHRFTSLPTLPTGANITSAYIKFTFRSGQSTPSAASGMSMLTYCVTAKQWYEATSGSKPAITWNNQPYGDWGYGNIPFVYSGSNLSYFNATVTAFIKKWYSGSMPNYGIDFTYNDEDYNDYNSIVSSEGTASRAPILTINYSGGGDVYLNMNWGYMFKTAPYSTPFYNLTQGYHSSHLGIDIAAPANTKVYSTAAGTVMSSGFNSSMGYYVVVKTNSSDSTGRLITRNMHFIGQPPVSTGQTVTKGMLIGKVGNTGDSSGNHLHFDVNNMNTWDGPTLRNNPSRTINPERFWQ